MSALQRLLAQRALTRANPASPANPEYEISNLSKISSRHSPELTSDLERRIRYMASRWSYTCDELAEVLALARMNPDGWLGAVALDEQRFGAQAAPLTPEDIAEGMGRRGAATGTRYA